MSRIFGVVDRPGVPDVLGSIMSSALAKGRRWNVRLETFGSGAIGLTAAAPDPVAALPDVRVVLDGTIVNAEDFDVVGGDAALVRVLYRSYGFSGALTRLGGDFAVAVHDSTTGRTYLGRDRLGVKPLYYTTRGRGLAFASQPSGLLALADVPRAVNRRYVAMVASSHYRTFDNSPDSSPFAAVSQLPAGHVLEWDGRRATVRPYWSLLDSAQELDGTEDELAERYRELLLDAVRRRVARAGNAVFTLSGGMDSSSVLASAVRATGAAQPAYSTVYSDRTFDERDEIRSMLGLVSQWHPVAVDDPDVFGLVRRMVAAHDEPVATATWLSHFVLCEAAAADGATSLFGGLGGDELNAGEYEHFLFHFADLVAAGRLDDLGHEVERWAAHHDHPIYRKSREVVDAELARRVDPVRGLNLPDTERITRYRAALNREWFDLDTFEPVMDHPFATHLKNRAYQDLTRETTPCCLRAEDRQTSWFGLDHFDPFLDHRVVEFMFGVAGDLKIRDGITKRLLRTAMREVLPEDTRTRVAKVGWNAPAHRWFVGRSGDELADLVHSRKFRDRGVYDVAVVQRLLDEHREIVESGAPRENHMMFLWQLVNLEAWFEWLAAL